MATETKTEEELVISQEESHETIVKYGVKKIFTQKELEDIIFLATYKASLPNTEEAEYSEEDIFDIAKATDIAEEDIRSTISEYRSGKLSIENVRPENPGRFGRLKRKVVNIAKITTVALLSAGVISGAGYGFYCLYQSKPEARIERIEEMSADGIQEDERIKVLEEIIGIAECYGDGEEPYKTFTEQFLAEVEELGYTPLDAAYILDQIGSRSCSYKKSTNTELLIITLDYLKFMHQNNMSVADGMNMLIKATSKHVKAVDLVDDAKELYQK